MGKIAFVFSGQGDQFPGMGKDLSEKFPAAAAVMKACDRIRPGTSAQCFEGTDAELAQTVNTQPCLFAMESALAAALQANGIRADAVAGFSLGEITAATHAGLFDLETGFRLVCRRGQLMQQAAENQETSMMAVIKLSPETVRSLCSKYVQVYPVNFNCPGQIAVSGLAEQMPAFAADVKAAGGRAVPLKVKGGFHSPFMADAAAVFEEELQNCTISAPQIPLYSNLTAAPYDSDPVKLLSHQICNPVQWETLVHNMISSGIDTFLEIGPGKTLTNLIRKIDLGVTARPALEYLEEVLC